jgi:hypothetical protein
MIILSMREGDFKLQGLFKSDFRKCLLLRSFSSTISQVELDLAAYADLDIRLHCQGDSAYRIAMHLELPGSAAPSHPLAGTSEHTLLPRYLIGGCGVEQISIL